MTATYGYETSHWAKLFVNTLECLRDESIVADVAFVCLDLDAKLVADLLGDIFGIL